MYILLYINGQTIKQFLCKDERLYISQYLFWNINANHDQMHFPERLYKSTTK